MKRNADAGNPEITVGSLAVAKLGSGVCRAGEVGVCYEVYQLGKRPGYSFIFERGGYDGFSPEDVNTFLDVSGRVSRHAGDYEFTNVGKLDADYRAGRFASAFEEQRRGQVLQWPEPESARPHEERGGEDERER
jgi:hypothetical protein